MLLTEARAHEHELVTTEPAQPVLPAHDPARPRCHLGQQVVTGVVPVSVVDVLEVVDVEVEQPHRSVSGAGQHQLLSDESGRSAAVGKTGQSVRLGKLDQSIRHQLASGDVDVEEHGAGAGIDRCRRGAEHEPPVLDRRGARILEFESLTIALEDLAKPPRNGSRGGSRRAITHRQVVDAETGRFRRTSIEVGEQPPSLVRVDDHAVPVDDGSTCCQPIEGG